MNSLKAVAPFEAGKEPSQAWSLWKEKFDIYMEAGCVGNRTVSQKRALLLHVIGDEGFKLYKTLSFEETGEDLTVEVILDKISEYYKPLRNEVFRGYEFHSYKQQQDQKVDDFVTELKRLATDCDYGTVTDRLIRDRLVVGINDTNLRERMLREPTLTLHDAITMCRAAETSKIQASIISKQNNPEILSTAASVDKIAKFSRAPNLRQGRFWQQGEQYNRFDNQRSPVAQGSDKFNCRNCGLIHGRRECPAYDKECFNCGKLHHYSKLCRSGRRVGLNKVHTVEDPGQSDENKSRPTASLSVNRIEEVLHIDTVESSPAENATNSWIEVLQIGDREIQVQFKLDTGAEVNVIPEAIYKKVVKSFCLKQTNSKLQTYTGGTINVLGVAVLKVINKKKQFCDLKFHVVNGETQPLIGLQACVNLGLIKRIEIVQKVELSKEIVLKEYSDLFTGIGKLPGKHKIIIRNNAIPHVSPARKIPLALESAFKVQIKLMLDHDIIAKVEEPTEWVNPIVVIKKDDGTVRICLDPRQLNEYIERAHHFLPPVNVLLSKLHGAKIFSLLDASKAFYMVELDEDSSYLCTFATIFGRFRFKRLPFGLKSAPEIFQSCIEKVFQHDRLGDSKKECLQCYQDDILIWGNSHSDHDSTLIAALQNARKSQVKLNPDKTIIGVKQLKYLGHLISEDGVTADPHKVNVIVEFPKPIDKAALMRFLGMINYLSAFISEHSQKTAYLRKLLCKETPFTWDATAEQQFNNLKTSMTKTPVLAFYDPNLQLVIQADASSIGIGSVLMQNKKPIAYTSATFRAAQCHYPQIVKEFYAIVFSLEHFHYYTFGNNVTVLTDHKPLLGLVCKPYEKITPVLQCLLMKYMRYDVELIYVPGTSMEIADTLSRAPSSELCPDLQGIKTIAAIQVLPTFSDVKLKELQNATGQDVVLGKILGYLQLGWPHKLKEIPDSCKIYWNMQDELYESEGLVCRGQCLVIPFQLRKEILGKLHATHRGIVATSARAKESVFWPGMSQDIKLLIQNCDICAKYQKANQLEPLQPREIPQYPWQQIAMDYFYCRSADHIVIVDSFSLYCEVFKTPSQTADSLVTLFKSVFARTGYPSVVISDQGPPYSSMIVQNFFKTCDIKWSPSSSYYARSNGLVEKTIQTVKNQLIKSTESDIHDVMMAYNSTPTILGHSPSYLFMGRKIRTSIPITPAALAPAYAVPTFEHRKEIKETQKFYADKGTKELEELNPGQAVWYTDNTLKYWKPATIIKLLRPRSYELQTSEGNIINRNRVHLKFKFSDRGNKVNTDEAKQNEPQPSPVPQKRETCRPKRDLRLPTHFQEYDMN